MKLRELKAQSQWNEVKLEHIDENGIIYIDGYLTDDQNEEGKNIGTINPVTLEVTYKDDVVVDGYVIYLISAIVGYNDELNKTLLINMLSTGEDKKKYNSFKREHYKFDTDWNWLIPAFNKSRTILNEQMILHKEEVLKDALSIGENKHPLSILSSKLMFTHNIAVQMELKEIYNWCVSLARFVNNI